jgi:hypothetical protein
MSGSRGPVSGLEAAFSGNIVQNFAVAARTFRRKHVQHLSGLLRIEVQAFQHFD